MICKYMYVSGDQPGADIGPLISPAAKQRVLSLVESGVKDGANLLLDGTGIVVPGYEKGNFVGPTLLHNVKVIFLCFNIVEMLHGVNYNTCFDLTIVVVSGFHFFQSFVKNNIPSF